jgi:hypothetical protein
MVLDSNNIAYNNGSINKYGNNRHVMHIGLHTGSMSGWNDRFGGWCM